MKKENQVLAIKRKDGVIFTVGDKFTYKNEGATIVRGKRSRRRMRVSGFEKHDMGWYVLYMPQYGDGKIEKENAWRACDLERAILIK